MNKVYNYNVKSKYLNTILEKNRWLIIILTRLIMGVLLDYLLLRAIPQGKWGTNTTFNWIVGFNKWDYGWYSDIAINGYKTLQHTAFFPGYPIEIAIGRFFGISVQYSSVIISWIAFIIFSYYFYKLVEENFGGDIAENALILLAWNPASIFFISGYSESSFILFTILAFYYYLKYKKVKKNIYIYLTCLFAGISSLFRLTGIVTFLAILVDYLWRNIKEVKNIKFLLRTVLFSLIGEFGVISYMIFLKIRFNNPIAFISAERYWNRVHIIPLESVLISLYKLIKLPLSFDGNIYVTFVLNDVVAIFAVLIIILIIININKKRSILTCELTLYTFISFYIAVSTSPGGSPESIARYIMTIFPLYIIIVRKFTDYFIKNILLPINICFAIIGQLLFNLGYWFT